MINRLVPFLAFILIAQALGIASGLLFMPGDWFAGLNKPYFNPPSWVFAPVWTFLYLLIGIAGGLAWRWDPQSGAVKVWFIQIILNGGWSAVFFGLKQPSAALIVILALLLAILSFMKRTRRELKLATWLFFPYLLWVSFATLLNAAFASLN